MATRMQQRRGTAAQWTGANPILAAGEIGFESDTSKFKIGDGVNHWDDLVYYSSAADLAAIIDGAPDLLNTLGELAAALGDDPDIITTLQTTVGSKQDIIDGVSNTEIGYLNGVTGGIQGQIDLKADISDLETKQDRITNVSDTEIGYLDGVTSSIQTQLDGKVAAIDLSNHESDTTNIHGITDTSALATKTYADGAVSTHSSDTTSVHGIADTSVLATITNVSDAIDSAEAYTDSQIDSHVAITTSVHGIADTSKLVKTDATSTTLTGALTVNGDFTVGGTTTTVNTANLNVTDPLIYMGDGNTGNTVDLGIVSAFNDGTYQHTGLVRDSSAGTWKLFKGVTDEPTTTINFSQGTLDDISVKNITAAGVVFTDGTQAKEGVPSRTPIINKTDSYTLSSLTERDSLVEVAKSTATTITIPAESSVNYPVGTSIDVLQTSTGQVTIAGAAGVTVNATPGLKLRTQWSSATLFKRAADTWVVYGDLTA